MTRSCRITDRRRESGKAGRSLIRLLLASLLFLGAAQAEASAFLGQWVNPDPAASGLMHVAISPNGGDRVDVRAYGDCHPNECDWGIVQGKTFSRDPKSGEVEIIVATFHYGFAHRTVTFRKAAAGRLSFEMTIEFADNSQRHDYVVGGTLKQTSWAGPIAQVWQRQAGMTTGWGGGARSGASPAPTETCKTVDTRGAHAVQQNGLWRVVANGQSLIEAGHDGNAAMLGEVVFRHYRFDRRCTVGGPWQTYWKSGDDFAGEKIGGVSCIAFHPTTAHLTHLGQDWAIVDGVTTVATFGVNKSKADATLGLVRTRRLTAKCYVRYPDPVMTFWLAAPRL
jgi:hypothetical protein